MKVKFKVAVAIDEHGQHACMPINDSFDENTAFDYVIDMLEGFNIQKFVLEFEAEIPEIKTITANVDNKGQIEVKM